MEDKNKQSKDCDDKAQQNPDDVLKRMLNTPPVNKKQGKKKKSD